VPGDAQAFLTQVPAVFAYVLSDNRFVLAAVSVYGSEGWGFKSSRARQLEQPCAAYGDSRQLWTRIARDLTRRGAFPRLVDL